ncbi:hypothetical protein EV421DRAFT_2022720 [Armillaria borealis]|uniref:Uncharacterized protein n=1 Tax=Armillaria borealis TaxID=47425 RepID=A0AA39J400_9AGAR|nr:hypothetical protein EV421DRAFT_2022720 [Armillaria borealis]
MWNSLYARFGPGNGDWVVGRYLHTEASIPDEKLPGLRRHFRFTIFQRAFIVALTRHSYSTTVTRRLNMEREGISNALRLSPQSKVCGQWMEGGAMEGGCCGCEDGRTVVLGLWRAIFESFDGSRVRMRTGLGSDKGHREQRQHRGARRVQHTSLQFLSASTESATSTRPASTSGSSASSSSSTSSSSNAASILQIGSAGILTVVFAWVVAISVTGPVLVFKCSSVGWL